MKKFFTGVLTIAMLAAFACGGGTEEAAGGEKAAGGDSAVEATDGGQTEPAGDAMSDHPWGNAQVGDWAKYEMTGASMTWTVTAVSDTEVTYDAVTEAAGMTMPAQSMTIPLVVAEAVAEVATEGPKVDISEETVEAAGSSFACKVYTSEIEGLGTSVTYMSSDMPLGGLIKSVTNGDVSMELVEWGHAAAEEAAAEEAPAE